MLFYFINESNAHYYQRGPTWQWHKLHTLYTLWPVLFSGFLVSVYLPPLPRIVQQVKFKKGFGSCQKHISTNYNYNCLCLLGTHGYRVSSCTLARNCKARCIRPNCSFSRAPQCMQARYGSSWRAQKLQFGTCL